MAKVILENIYKVYDRKIKAVNNFNLEIEDKEFVVFVGPSGCGKSTTLRMIAGLEDITSGNIYIGDKLVNETEPKDRDISMVFQNYALYPHMTLYENMSFGLLNKKVPADIIDAKIKEAAEILGITDLLERKPKALSGGQRQRVALGRAIVRDPKVFLLDEPLSNLDAKLRVQMRSEIAKLHRKLETTFIYVTHDQTEAMTMGTRIVVMKDGFIQQVDTPSNLYEHPVNEFVATFLGSPQMNLFEVMLIDDDGSLYIEFGEGGKRFLVPDYKRRQLVSEEYIGQKVIFGMRPEDIDEDGDKNYSINVDVEIIEKLGSSTLTYCHIAGREDYTIATFDAQTKVRLDDNIEMFFNIDRMHLFSKDDSMSLFRVPLVNYLNVAIDQLPDSVSKRSVQELSTETLVGFNPDKIKFERDDNCLKLDYTITAVIDHSAYKVLYGLCGGERLIAKTTMDFENKIQDVSIYINADDISIYDKQTLYKLTSDKYLDCVLHEGVFSQVGKHPYIIDADVRDKKDGVCATIQSFDMLGDKMILNVKLQKSGKLLSYLVNTDDSIYVTMPLYFKRIKKNNGAVTLIAEDNNDTIIDGAASSRIDDNE